MYKTMLGGMKSQHGRCKWKIGEWKKIRGTIKLCERGFHCSERLIDAMCYVSPIIVTEVECGGDHLEEDRKQVWSEMRVIRAWKWTKNDSVALSIYSAELCLKNFEKVFPDDNRPRKAIEAAKEWLKNPTRENESVARSAAESASWSAWSAWSAAESASWSAVESVWSAVESASWSAWSAVESVWSAVESVSLSAGSAAESATKEKMLDKINKWCIKRLKDCEVIK